MTRCPHCDLVLDDLERFCPGCGGEAPQRVVDVSTTLRESFHSASDDDGETEYAFGSKRLVKTAPAPSPAARQPPLDAARRAEEESEVPAQPEERQAPQHAVPEEEVDEEPDDGVPDEVAPRRAPVAVVAAAAVDEHTPFRPYVVLPPPRAVALREPEPGPLLEAAPETEAPRRGGWKLVVLLVMLAGLCAGTVFVVSGEDHAPTTQPITAEAKDGSISLDAPSGWRIESREPGVLGIGEPAHDMHVHATAIRRSALGDGLSLTRRAEEVQAEFVESLADADASRAQATKVGPYPAIRQVLSTSNVIYVHTVVKMPKYFVNALAWTTAERFDQEQDTLLDVVATLQSSG